MKRTLVVGLALALGVGGTFVGSEKAFAAKRVSTIVYDKYVAGSWDLYTMKADGTGEQRLTNDTAQEENADIHPATGKIVFSSNRTGEYEIYSMNADGTNVQQLTNNPFTDFNGNPKWSPDGSKILFKQDGYIAVMNADGTGVTHLAVGDRPSVWSPDGQWIYYGQGPWLRKMRADGSENTILWDDMPPWNLTITHDGTKLIFEEPNTMRIYTANVDGTNRQMIFDGKPNSGMYSFDLNPQVSPTDDKIIFGYNGSKDAPSSAPINLYTINLDGTGLAPLTSGTDYYAPFDWETVITP